MMTDSRVFEGYTDLILDVSCLNLALKQGTPLYQVLIFLSMHETIITPSRHFLTLRFHRYLN